MEYAHILTIGTAKVWHWTLARSYFWRSLSEIDNDFRRILSIWRNLSFTCCLFEVVLDTVPLVWNSLSFGPSLAPFRPGKWSAILSQSDKKSYTFRNVYITHLRDLKMGAGENTWLQLLLPYFYLFYCNLYTNYVANGPRGVLHDSEDIIWGFRIVVIIALLVSAKSSGELLCF